MTDSRFVVNQEEFDKAALTPAGFYLWRVDSVKGTDKTYGEGPDAVTFPIIQMKLTATHTVESDETGAVVDEVELENHISRPFEEFKLTGSGARKLQTLYRAVTGRTIAGDGENVDLLACAEELLGGQAWNNVFHTSFKRDDDTIGWKALLTNTFKSRRPTRVRVETEED